MEEKSKINNRFTMMDSRGVETTYDVLFTFESEETNKNYIAYTDNTRDENGKINVYASTYDPDDEETELKALESEKEWKVIETILQTLQEEMKNKQENDEQ